MFKENKKLLLALVILGTLFFIVRWMKADKNIRNFKTELFTLDTAQVASFSLFSKAENHEEIKFEKGNGSWTVSKNNISSTIPAAQVSGMLNSLLTIKPQRLAARTKEKWAQYEVSDSLGTRLIARNSAGKELVDLTIGKFSYKQPPPQANFSGQNNISGLTYVRNTKEVETYATEGFLTMTFNRDFNSFRDKGVVKCTPENVKSLSFVSPEGDFTLNKLGDDWMMGEARADSISVVKYVNQLRNITASKIDDLYKATGSGDYQCTISGDNMEEIKVSAYPVNGIFKLRSSQNSNTILESDSTGVFSKLFKRADDFIAKE